MDEILLSVLPNKKTLKNILKDMKVVCKTGNKLSVQTEKCMRLGIWTGAVGQGWYHFVST